MFFDDLNGLVVNIGNLNSYIGYISDELPLYSSDSVFGTLEDSKKNYYFDEINPIMNPMLKINKLLDKNKIVDPESYLKFINQMTNKINGDLSHQPLLLITKENENMDNERKKLAQILFEEYKTPCVYLANEAVTSLFVHGNYNGILLDSGAHETSLFPIHDGFLIKKEIKRLNFAGEHLTDLFKKEIVKKSDYSFEPQHNIIYNSKYFLPKDGVKEERITKIKRRKLDVSLHEFLERKNIRDLKEQLLGSKKIGFVPKLIKENDKETTIRCTSIELPDKTTIEFSESELKGYERYFFEKKTEFKESIELPLEIIKTILKCDNDIKRDLFSKIFVTGGNSSIRNFTEEIETRISQIQNINSKIKVFSSNRRMEKKMAPWIGGSILGSTAPFQNLWISKFEYQECGENIILRKCIN